ASMRIIDCRISRTSRTSATESKQSVTSVAFSEVLKTLSDAQLCLSRQVPEEHAKPFFRLVSRGHVFTERNLINDLRGLHERRFIDEHTGAHGGANRQRIVRQVQIRPGHRGR